MFRLNKLLLGLFLSIGIFSAFGSDESKGVEEQKAGECVIVVIKDKSGSERKYEYKKDDLEHFNLIASFFDADKEGIRIPIKDTLCSIEKLNWLIKYLKSDQAIQKELIASRGIVSLFNLYKAADYLGLQNHKSSILLKAIFQKFSNSSASQVEEFMQSSFSKASFVGFSRYIKLNSSIYCLERTLSGHARSISSVQVSLDGSRVLTASSDFTARVWDVESGLCLHTLVGHADMIDSAQFSSDGSRVVTASREGTAKIWSALNGACLHTLIGYAGGVGLAQFSPDGRKIVTRSHDGTAKVWDVESGACLHTLVGHTDMIDSAQFSPDGSRVVTASQDSTAKIWSVDSGVCLQSLVGHAGDVTLAQFGPDGSRVVTASRDLTAKVWNVESGACLKTLRCYVVDRITLAQFSSDGSKVVTASGWDSTAKIWDVESGIRIKILDGHAGGVTSAQFSPDGSRVLTASSDCTARVWDVENSACLQTLAGHTDEIYSAQFSPDSSRVVTVSWDSTAKIWDMLNYDSLANMKQKLFVFWLIKQYQVKNKAINLKSSNLVKYFNELPGQVNRDLYRSGVVKKQSIISNILKAGAVVAIVGAVAFLGFKYFRR
jgi:WD40 repeat protein